MEPLRHTFVVRFGTYEVSFQSGEVRKAAVRIRVQQQPLKLLEVLLEHPGEVVTREELRGRVWPNESFGDFDQAVNIAITKLRSALGDSAENPRYIETLPKRGYRFIADVSFVDADDRVQRPESVSADSPVTESVHQVQGNGLAVPSVTEPGSQLQSPGLAAAPRRRLWSTWHVIMALALVLGLAILSVLLLRSRGHR
ncbi:MAG: winged helix-turn-helix domain-containing protein, partial [Acidobacteriaceae bacterium]